MGLTTLALIAVTVVTKPLLFSNKSETEVVDDEAPSGNGKRKIAGKIESNQNIFSDDNESHIGPTISDKKNSLFNQPSPADISDEGGDDGEGTTASSAGDDDGDSQEVETENSNSLSGSSYSSTGNNLAKHKSKKNEPSPLTSSTPATLQSYASGVPLLQASGATAPSTSTDTGSSTNTSLLSCTTNYTTGTYSIPLAVTISCTGSANVRYCLHENTCCDPSSGSGQLYTGVITVGSTNGTFCLSYIGSGSTVTSLAENTYIINNLFPNLQTSFPVLQTQTTELTNDASYAANTAFYALYSALSSMSDFGKPGLAIGQINLKSNDPTTLDCEDVATNYATLFTSPAPIVTLPPSGAGSVDITTLDNTQQVDVPFILSNMYYGDNYIMSYMVNNNLPSPVYSCSTTKVILEDFAFFSSEPITASMPVSNVRDFTGGFTSYGFFETDITTLPRAPAGSDDSLSGSEKLESGLVSVFY